MQKDTTKIQQEFAEKNKNIVIVGHTYPDGDAIGSGLALYEYLSKLGHQVRFILPDPYPQFLAWMQGTSNIVLYSNNKKQVKQLIEDAHIIIFVDLNSPGRLKHFEDEIRQAMKTKKTIVFDHHIEPDTNFTLMYWDVEVSSTAELIYRFIDECEHKNMITQSMAENLYVGMMTDTGSFSFSCNSPVLYEILAHLFTLNIDGARIHQQVYSTFSENRMRLLGHSLFEKLVVHQEYGGAYIALAAHDMNRFHYRIGDTEGLVNYTMAIKGIHFGALLTERPDSIKLSFRSEGNIDVNEIARKFFNGGGHKNAAGANFKGTLTDACKMIDDIIINHLNTAE
jgi:bifunctional oligoribonuclease and PAP phosphatase NrnA